MSTTSSTPSLSNNIRSPQTPAVQNHSTEAITTGQQNHQNGPVTLPIDEPLPAGYMNKIIILFY